jgi:pimeloyl-ACP methyl ester carboxylesterase
MDGSRGYRQAGPRPYLAHGTPVPGPGWFRPVAMLLLLVLTACGAPVTVQRMPPQQVHRELTANVVSSGELSDFTRNVLRFVDTDQDIGDDPEAVIARLRQAVVDGVAGANAVFAMAELAFAHAEAHERQDYYLAAAFYAYAYLFPEEADAPPDPFDPRFRWAVDIYNRSLVGAFRVQGDDEVRPAPGSYLLPSGSMQIAAAPDLLVWQGYPLTRLVPTAELHVSGLRNRYRQPGLGAPLAATPVVEHPEHRFQVAPRLKVPVTILLRIPDPRGQLAQRRVHATLEAYAGLETETVTVAGREVPLEAEPTATMAYGLSDPGLWQTEFQGFLQGDFLGRLPSQLVALQAHKPGRIPVVFVHGTASSAGRWADMVNDLLSDPRIRERFEFWFFAYETGNPIPYSALRLREALKSAVRQLDPQGREPALRDVVVVGHSQGGLLAKMTAIDTGSKLWDAISLKPLDELRLRPETRDLLQRSMFVKPLPFVRRIVFIATPQRGSYLTQYSLGGFIAGLVRLPFTLISASQELTLNNPGAFRVNPARIRIGSMYGMTPGSPFISTLADIPLAPGVHAHSIIAVQGDGPVAEGDDGVVRYESAHIDGVESELVIRSGHSVQGHPQAVLELRRILLLHAEEACRTVGIGCLDRPALVSLAR